MNDWLLLRFGNVLGCVSLVENVGGDLFRVENRLSRVPHFRVLYEGEGDSSLSGWLIDRVDLGNQFFRSFHFPLMFY